MERVPKDYDIATSALPAQVLELFPQSDEIGAHFGVILVKKHGAHFEIATFRADGPYADGRHPEHVTFTSAEEDAKRRDFTINGLFEHPLTEEIIAAIQDAGVVGSMETLQEALRSTRRETDDAAGSTPGFLEDAEPWPEEVNAGGALIEYVHDLPQPARSGLWAERFGAEVFADFSHHGPHRAS